MVVIKSGMVLTVIEFFFPFFYTGWISAGEATKKSDAIISEKNKVSPSPEYLAKLELKRIEKKAQREYLAFMSQCMARIDFERNRGLKRADVDYDDDPTARKVVEMAENKLIRLGYKTSMCYRHKNNNEDTQSFISIQWK